MKKSLLYLTGIIFSALLLSNCQKHPVPAFSYLPINNPEAGDTIYFVNESLEAETFEWDLGNELSSEEQDPYTIYEDPGNYDVKLTATNSRSSIMITETITINDPTGILFLAYPEDDTASVVENCEVRLFEDEYSYNFDYFNPEYFDYTGSDGFVLFLNVEPQVYFVELYKEVENGILGAAGYLDKITQNMIIWYTVPLRFYHDSLFNKKTQGTLRSIEKSNNFEKSLDLPGNL